VVNTIGEPFSIEKLLMVDYTTSVVMEWFVPRVETLSVASWCPEPGGRRGVREVQRGRLGVKIAWTTGGADGARGAAGPSQLKSAWMRGRCWRWVRDCGSDRGEERLEDGWVL
jgi:hypothetical protein